MVVNTFRSSYLILTLLLSSYWMLGQKSFEVVSIKEDITIDGNLDESIWDTAMTADSFFQYNPVDTIQTPNQTELFFLMDKHYLYIGGRCSTPGDYFTISSLKRDYRAGGNDNLTILLDLVGDGNNAYFFGLNPYGVRREGIITGGGTANSGFSTTWDQAWYGDASFDESGWTMEMKIPFSILQYNTNKDQWRMNAYRFDMQSYETSSWVQIPNTQTIFNLRFMGDVIFPKKLKPTGLNLTMVPYLRGSVNADFETNDGSYLGAFDIGGDIKMNIGSNMKLDATINPDFSQIEVDQQITNLDRFELFFPERRLFFLENADLFSNFGFKEINPFFSRRIGLGFDDASGFYVENTIFGGARLSGSINKNWRLGLMTMQTGTIENIGIAPANYSVLSAQRRLGSRSNISFLLTNKLNFETETIQNPNPMNTVIGTDLNFANASNSWFGKVFIHTSLGSQENSFPIAHGLSVDRIKKGYSLRWKHTYVSENYDADIGFIRRENIISVHPEFRLYFHSSENYVNRQGPTANVDAFYRPGEYLSDLKVRIGYNARTIYNHRFSAGWVQELVYLTDDFDPTGTDASPLSEGSLHTFSYIETSISTDRSLPLSMRFNPTLGSYYTGSRYGAKGSFTYRFQPFGSLDLNYNYNFFDLPHTNGLIHTVLIGPKLNVSFTKSLFLSTFVQYNTQLKNTNLNLRLQWRYAPVSDIFIVFTDNYFSDPTDANTRFIGDIRNRSFVLKANYWLGL